MRLQCTTLQHCKSEYASAGRCEDAAFTADELGCFAIADGVGMASYSDLWAHALVKAFIEEPLRQDDDCEKFRWLQRARSIMQLPPDSPDLPYYARDNLDRPTYATFLGVYLQGKDSPHDEDCIACHITAVGDSCALHYSDGILQSGFPIESASDFNRTPTTLSSKGRDECWKSFRFHTLNLKEDDLLILATDAVAQWLVHEENTLEKTEVVRKDRMELLCGQTAETWPGFVHALRAADKIEDDDSTAVIIKVADSAGPLSGQIEHRNKIHIARKKEYDRTTRGGVMQFFSTWCGSPKKTFRDIAISYGGGVYFSEPMKEAEIRVIRESKEKLIAFESLLTEIERHQNKPKSGAHDLEILWNQHRDILKDEPATEGLRMKLRELGIE